MKDPLVLEKLFSDPEFAERFRKATEEYVNQFILPNMSEEDKDILMYNIYELTREKLDLQETNCQCYNGDYEFGDTLYYRSSWDGGIEYNYIRPILFCPKCGRRLPKEED